VAKGGNELIAPRQRVAGRAMDVRPIVLDFRSRMTLSFSSSFEVFVVPTESHNDGGRDTRGFNVVVHSAGKYLSCPRDTLHAQRVLQGYCLSSNSPAFLPSGPTGPRTAAITRLSILLATKAPIDDSAPFEEAAILSHPAQIILSSPPPPPPPDVGQFVVCQGRSQMLGCWHNPTGKVPQIYRSLRERPTGKTI